MFKWQGDYLVTVTEPKTRGASATVCWRKGGETARGPLQVVKHLPESTMFGGFPTTGQAFEAADEWISEREAAPRARPYFDAAGGGGHV